MTIRRALLDMRIDENTTVIIKDMSGRPIICGRWYEDKILSRCDFNASFDFLEERNIAILQLI